MSNTKIGIYNSSTFWAKPEYEIKRLKHLVEQLELRNRLLKEQNEVLLRANRDRAKTIESLRRLLPG